jgi:hypothetical protein
MKRFIVALIVGVALGYRWGYVDGNEGRGTIISRTLDRFGTSKIKNAQDTRDKRVQEASRP